MISALTFAFCDLYARLQPMFGIKLLVIRIAVVKCAYVVIFGPGRTCLEFVLTPMCRYFLHLFGRHQHKPPFLFFSSCCFFESLI